MPCRGLADYASPNPTTVLSQRIHVDNALRMPPKPAPLLTDRQLEIMDRWLMNPLP